MSSSLSIWWALGAVLASLAASPSASVARPLPTDEAMAAPGTRGSSLTIEEGNGIPQNLGSFDIAINPGATLAGNQAALDAFDRAASQWEQYFSDPITVNIDADLQSLMSTSIIGQAFSVILSGEFDIVRDAMVLDSSFEFDDGIVASLPTSAQFAGSLPPGFSFDGDISLHKANAKALGFTGLDIEFGVTDTTITFNSDFNFDFDNSDGVSPGTIDFESVAAHEIGHALGFSSEVDRIDAALEDSMTLDNVSPRTIDLFRFEDGSANDPDDAADFTTAVRFLQTGGDPIFDEVIEFGITGAEGELSSGAFAGDGQQAGHWKQNFFPNSPIGVMDPNFTFGEVVPVGLPDVRVLDLAGYNFIPEPSIFPLLLGAGALLGRRKRQNS